MRIFFEIIFSLFMLTVIGGLLYMGISDRKTSGKRKKNK